MNCFMFFLYNSLDVCKEWADSLRLFFDFNLARLLLYEEEEEQYLQLLAGPAHKP